MAMPAPYQELDTDVALVESLTWRELRVLRLLCRGWSNRRIADTQFISVNTVKYHLKNVYWKLDVHKRTEAVWVATHLKLIYPDSLVGKGRLKGESRHLPVAQAGG